GAIEDYTKAIELDPQYKEAYDSRGWHKHLLSDYRGAIVDYTKAIEIDPESKMSLGIYSRRALSKERLDDYRGAIADYNKIIEINPQNIRGYYNRGWAKLELGDIHGGCLDWSKAGELGDFDAYEMIRKYCN
ncbi:MAG: tetratricopeptide repeat protein, partial [Balneolaceae bacterium]|nr:tetratricopeptide repeat protein [Balneolaceae bacterium]